MKMFSLECFRIGSLSDPSDLTTSSVNHMPDIELCLYPLLWTESFGIVRRQRHDDDDPILLTGAQ